MWILALDHMAGRTVVSTHRSDLNTTFVVALRFSVPHSKTDQSNEAIP